MKQEINLHKKRTRQSTIVVEDLNTPLSTIDSTTRENIRYNRKEFYTINKQDLSTFEKHAIKQQRILTLFKFPRNVYQNRLDILGQKTNLSGFKGLKMHRVCSPATLKSN